METLALPLVGGVLASIITLLLLYTNPFKGLGVVFFITLIAFTFLSPFLAYVLLAFFKPIIDSLYELHVGPLKITQLFSVYSTAIWMAFLILKRGIRPPVKWMDVAHILLLLPVPFVLLFSPNLKGLDLALRILSGWGYYFMAREMGKGELKWLKWAFLLSTFFPAVTGYLASYGYIPGGFHEGAFKRLKGVYYDATAFGFELVPGFLILLSSLSSRFNPLVLILNVALLYLFFLTYTRALWISTLFSLAVALFSGRGKKVGPALLFAVVIGGIILFYPQISARFSEHSLGTDPDSFNGRMAIWRGGFGRFFSLHPLAMFFGLSTTGSPIGLYTHNTYLTFLFDMGFLGFTVFLIWLSSAAYFSLSYDGEHSTLLRTALVFVIVSGLTSGSILYPNFQWFFLTVLGLAVNDAVSKERDGRPKIRP